MSLYIVDRNSTTARAAVTSQLLGFAFTDLHRLEVRTAFEQGVFRRAMSSAQASEAWANLIKDVRLGRLIPARINWQITMRLARNYSREHTSEVGSRSFDILHVACASTLGLRQFYSFDQRQRALAARLGLRALP